MTYVTSSPTQANPSHSVQIKRNVSLPKNIAEISGDKHTLSQILKYDSDVLLQLG